MRLAGVCVWFGCIEAKRGGAIDDEVRRINKRRARAGASRLAHPQQRVGFAEALSQEVGPWCLACGCGIVDKRRAKRADVATREATCRSIQTHPPCICRRLACRALRYASLSLALARFFVGLWAGVLCVRAGILSLDQSTHVHLPACAASARSTSFLTQQNTTPNTAGRIVRKAGSERALHQPTPRVDSTHSSGSKRGREAEQQL